MSLPRGVSNSFVPACRLVSTSFITACRGVSKSFVIASRRLSKQIFRYCLSGSERILRHFRLVNRFRGVDTSFSVQSCSLPLNKSFVFFRCCLLSLKLSFGPTFFQRHGHGFQYSSTSSTSPFEARPSAQKIKSWFQASAFPLTPTNLHQSFDHSFHWRYARRPLRYLRRN